MDRVELRLECLKMAVALAGEHNSATATVQTAEKFWDFLAEKSSPVQAKAA